MSSVWTAERAIALSPDEGSTKNGKKLASAAKWVTLGQSERAIWGECKGSGKNPYRTQVDLSEPAFKCSCPSRKFPCKHGLGLLLLFAEQPACLPAGDPPDWVEEWLQKRDGREQAKAQQQAKAADPVAQARRAEKRDAKVRAGTQELGLWLQDLVRQGLAAVPSQPYSFWETPAARMVDAQANGLARQIRDLAGIPYGGQDWPERLLARLGRLHLLLEGYERIETLPASTQADIRTQIGWTQNQEELLAASPDTAEVLRDRWYVLGKRVVAEERLRTQRLWLWGEASQRAALLLSFAATAGQPLDTSVVPGTAIDAELVFFASNYPLRALIKERYAPPEPVTAAVGYADLQAAFATWTQAVARQPWLERFPLPVREATLLPHDGRWFLQDAAGAGLAVAPGERLWEFFAVAGGHPVGVFGEWDGEAFLPLSLVAGGRFWDGAAI